MTATLNVNHVYLKSEALQQTNEGYWASVNVNFTYNFSKGWGVEANGYLSSDEINLQGTREPWNYYSFVINKKFKGDKFSLSLRGDNIFPPENRYLTQTFSTPEFEQEITNRYQSQYLWLSFNFKFGKKEVKAPPVRAIEEN